MQENRASKRARNQNPIFHIPRLNSNLSGGEKLPLESHRFSKVKYAEFVAEKHRAKLSLHRKAWRRRILGGEEPTFGAQRRSLEAISCQPRDTTVHRATLRASANSRIFVTTSGPSTTSGSLAAPSRSSRAARAPPSASRLPCRVLFPPPPTSLLSTAIGARHEEERSNNIEGRVVWSL